MLHWEQRSDIILHKSLVKKWHRNLCFKKKKKCKNRESNWTVTNRKFNRIEDFAQFHSDLSLKKTDQILNDPTHPLHLTFLRSSRSSDRNLQRKIRTTRYKSFVPTAIRLYNIIQQNKKKYFKLFQMNIQLFYLFTHACHVSSVFLLFCLSCYCFFYFLSERLTVASAPPMRRRHGRQKVSIPECNITGRRPTLRHNICRRLMTCWNVIQRRRHIGWASSL